MKKQAFVQMEGSVRCTMGNDDLVERYRTQAAESINAEAEKRLAEMLPVKRRMQLRATSLYDLIEEEEEFLLACFVRLGAVAAALQGHGGGIALTSLEKTDTGLDLVLDLTGACLSCGAAPGTLSGVKNDLEEDPEISRVRFSSTLLDSFDELGREFILAHGDVEFVESMND